MRKKIEESAWTIPNQRREPLPFVRDSPLRKNRNCEIDCKKESRLLLKSHDDDDIVANRTSSPPCHINISNNNNLTSILPPASNADRFYDSLNVACAQQNESPTKLYQRESDDTERFDSEKKSAPLTMTKTTIFHHRHSPPPSSMLQQQQQQKRHSPMKIEKSAATISPSKNTNCENLSILRHTFSSSSPSSSTSSLSSTWLSPALSPLSSSPTTSTLSLNMIFLRTTRTNLTEAQYEELSQSQQYVNMAQSYHEHHCCRSHHHRHQQQHENNLYHQHMNNDTKTISPLKTTNYNYRNSKILSTSTFQTQRNNNHNHNNNNNCSPTENNDRFQQFTKNIESQKQKNLNSRCDCDFSKISDLHNFRTINNNFYQKLLLKLISTTRTAKIKQNFFNDFNLINLLIILTILINIIPFVYGHNNITTNGSINNGEIVQNHQHQFYHQYASMARIETSEASAAAQREATGNVGIVNNIRREVAGADGGGGGSNDGNIRFSNFGGTTEFDDSADHRFDRIDNNDNIEMDEMLRPSRGDPSVTAADESHHDHHHLHHQATAAAASPAAIASIPILRSGGCHSCQQLEQVKADNLASIKRHILMRLKMDTLPNITAPVVPPEIIEKFYKSQQHQNAHTINNNRNNNNNNGGAGIGGNSREHLQQYSSPSASILNDGMQGDDPNAAYNFKDYGGGGSDGQLLMENRQGDGTGGGDDEDYEEDFFSVVNSIYVFPTTSHMRHNRKTDILHFPLTNNGHSTVSEATLHIFIRGQNSIRENAADLSAAAATSVVDGADASTQPDSGSSGATSAKTTNSITSTTNTINRYPEIVLKINRVLRHANSTHTQKGTEIRHLIPHNNDGMWITIDVTDMVIDWYNNGSQNHGVLIKTKETWMKQFVVIDESLTNKTYAPYIEVTTKDNRKRRSKRDTSLNCSESDNEVRCCRYPLEVNFRQFNWEWIIAPGSFKAYFCNGECKLGFLPKYTHTHLMQLSTAPQPCCSPTKMSPLALLYFNTEHMLVMSTIPNMAVDACSCS